VHKRFRFVGELEFEFDLVNPEDLSMTVNRAVFIFQAFLATAALSLFGFAFILQHISN
jgi:hypothetical protein